MTMTIHPQDQQRYGHHQFDTMSSAYPAQQPSFINPWPAHSHQSTAPSTHALYAASPQVAHSAMSSDHMGLDRHSQQPSSRPPVTTSASMAPYGSAIPVTSASAGSPPQLSMLDPSLARHGNLLSAPQDLMNMNRMHHPTTSPSYTGAIYQTSAPSPVHATYAPSPTNFEPLQYPQTAVRHNYLPSDADPQSRRYSQSSVSSSASYEQVDMALPRVPRGPIVDFPTTRGISTEEQRREFQSALEASQGMMNMKFDTSNQETPRAGVYNARSRGSTDAYGFPSAHSTSSSVSSASFSPAYYGSVDGGSVSDYSTAGSDIEGAGPRALPRPQGLMPNQPPAPQSMMGQFSSKVSSSTQKKHKCKVCDKRFTRPSSLQTHMYSHTGEKRKARPSNPPLPFPSRNVDETACAGCCQISPTDVSTRYSIQV